MCWVFTRYFIIKQIFKSKPSSSQHKMFFYIHCGKREVPKCVCYVFGCRDDLKMQYSVDICVMLLSL